MTIDVVKYAVPVAISQDLLAELQRPSILLDLMTRDRPPQPSQPVMGWCLAYTKVRLAVEHDPLSAALLALHSPTEYGECPECSDSEYGGPWPCPTVDLLADYYGLGSLV